MKKIVWSIIICMGFSLISFAKAKEIETAVKRVVVYEDRAMVIRSGTVNLESGVSELVVPGLPPSLLDDSVRIKGEAQGKVTVTGTEVRKAFLTDPRQKQVDELEKKLDDLRLEDKAMDDRLEALALEKKFVASIQSSTSDKISKEMLLTVPAPEQWAKVGIFLYESSLKISTEERSLQVAKKELAKKIEAVEKELNQVKSWASRDAKNIVISFEAAQPSPMNLEVSYVVPAATWRPVYDARADHDGGKVGFTYRAEVRQKTGEDWKGVELALSTTRPSVSGRMEELEPWYIGIWEPPQARDKFYLKAAARPAPEAPPAEAALPGGDLGAGLREEVVFDVARAEKAGAAVTFAIPRKQDIPSDGNSHGAVISTRDIQATFEYVATPKLIEQAYLMAKFKNDENYPLLAGQINLFLGPDFVGTSNLDTVAPGEEAELYLGIDEEIKVKRELIAEKTEKGGFLKGRPGEKSFHYRITVENFRKAKDTITVFDQIPVSQHPEVKVKLEEADPKPVVIEEKEKPGILSWKLELSPGEKKTIGFEFSVEYPKDKQPTGL